MAAVPRSHSPLRHGITCGFDAVQFRTQSDGIIIFVTVRGGIYPHKRKNIFENKDDNDPRLSGTEPRYFLLFERVGLLLKEIQQVFFSSSCIYWKEEG